ncbi:MAG: phosphatidylglycerophosphatase A [Alphaproteobacteria bacterium]|nr:phosphatidylglycerophosphatase A [Alphaproteobacteria bacterium]
MSRARLLKHPAHLIALGFGSGLSPVAPGTSGTLWAWASFLAMQSWFDSITIGWIILGALLLGWWACTVSAELLGLSDPGMIVWDEVVAFWMVLWLWLPATFMGQLAAFLLFRFFDMAKPEPVGWADRLFKSQRGWVAGWGILFDDLVAAFCTLLVLSLAVTWGWA